MSMNIIERVSQLLHPAECTEDESEAEIRFSQLLASLMVMAWFVEARDPYTGGHLWRVSQYARLLAEAGKLDSAEVARISLGGFLHDLGKIGVPDAILRKPASLSDEEYAVIKTHPEMGMHMLAGHPLAGLIKNAVYLHHERPDGLGYPRGLTFENIPLEARIVGVCDAFDAMTSHRPYRAGMPLERALGIVSEGLGRQFDPNFGRLLIELGETGQLDHIRGHSDDGIPLLSCPMCGPTLAIRREQLPGEHVYCRNCGGEFVLVDDERALSAEPTGRCGTPTDLQTVVDEVLIARSVETAVRAMPARELMQRQLSAARV
ncbi:MAG: HD domain-containing protein [Pseudogulbenkiania sp.]|nr:HD domain-containing protein [Pseudogulbenkiania sp.]